MAGYTRQSVADIVNGANITAPPLNAEFNQLAAAFDPSTGHSHDGSSGNSPPINLGTSVTGYLLPANGGAGGRNNTTAASVPTISDDAAAGYAPGSLWINGSTGRLYVCVYNTVNAAYWVEAMGVTPANTVVPSANNLVDLGTSTYQYKDIYVDGTGYIDAVSGDTITLTSNASIGGNLTLTGNAVISGNVTTTGTGYFGGNLSANSNFTVVGTAYMNGDVVLGNAATDAVTFFGRVNTSVLPLTTGTYSLGSATNQWQDLYIDGTANIDSLVADTADIDGGTIDNAVIGGTTPAAATFTNVTATGNLSVQGNVTVGDANTDTVTVNAQVSSDLVPSTDDARDLGSATKEWRNLFVDGIANIDNLVADTADINGGTIDGVVIGGTSAAAGSFTTINSSSLATLSSVDINGGAIDGTAIGGTSASTGAFTTITSSAGITGDVTGDLTGDVTSAGTSSFNNITVTGTVTGAISGNVTGNVSSTGSSTFNNVTINGTLNMDAGTTATITNLTDPTNAQDAATKNYVDTNDALKLNLAGGTMTGDITMSGGAKVTGLPTPTASSDAANKGYVDAEIAAVIDAAPGALDTLNELAAALGDDANFATTTANSLATKLPLAGGTMTGDIAMSSNKITGLGTPTNTGDATTKAYVDGVDATKLNLAGGTMTGSINMGANKVTSSAAPSASSDLTNKDYVDTQRDTRLATTGGTMTGDIVMGANKVTSSHTPAAGDDLTNKTYVDSILSSATASATSAAAAAASATAAAASETNAAASEQLAEDWAIKTSGTVDGTNYSAKYWATQADVGTVATNIADINTVAGNTSNINTVAGIDSDVTTVSGISGNVSTVSGISGNVTTVAGISSDVTTVAGISSDVSTVATDQTNVNTVATNIAAVNTVATDIAQVITAANDLNEAVSEIDTVSNNIASVNTVGTDITNVNTVASSIGGVNSVAGSISDVTTVAGNIADVNTVAGIAADVTTAATNVVDFNNRYLGPSATAPTTDPNGSALDQGDLYFDTVSNVMKVYGGAGWTTAASAVNGTAQRYTYTATSGQTTFSGADDNTNSLAYDAGYLDVYLNGVKIVNGTDFTATSGTSIVLASGATSGDILEVVAYGTFVLANFSINEANDVNISGGVSNGQTLVFNSSTGDFEPGDGLPSQSGNSGKYLTTDGSSPSWGTIAAPTPTAVSDQANTSTGYFHLPTGTTAQRPGSPAVGYTRMNTTIGSVEFYDGANWISTNLIPTINSITGTIYAGIASTLTLSLTNATDTVDIKYYEGGTLLATDSGVTVTSGSASSTVPSAVYGQTAGDTISIQIFNVDGTPSSNAISKTVIGLPTGGTITTSGSYRYHTFTSSGTFTVPSGSSVTADYLVVAGGGAGGGSGSNNSAGGGGGAGGYRALTSQSISAGSYTVTIGAGGSGNTSLVGNDGNTSSFNSTSSTGGGGGGRSNNNPLSQGRSGGSGGGGGAVYGGTTWSPGPTGGSGTSGQGNAGGTGYNSSDVAGQRGGGGGGASAAGTSAPSAGSGGEGGNGSTWLNGTTYAGGGGGGSYVTVASISGGTGGGGTGSHNYGTAGTANTGGGGGGSGGGNPTVEREGANGGSGIVIIRYPS